MINHLNYTVQPSGAVKRGRPKHPLTLKIEKFYLKSSKNEPTKENFLVFLHRSLEKILKNHKKLPTSNIPILKNTTDYSQLELILQNLNISNLYSILESMKDKQYQIKALKIFFLQNEAKIFYNSLIKLIFQDHINLNLLNVRFNLNCCLTSQHNNSCQVKWNLFKDYLQNDLISDLLSDPSSFNKKPLKVSDLLTYS